MTSDPKKMTFPPDFKIADKYILLKSIGKGSFGEVFLGQDIVTNNQVAIKIEVSKRSVSQLVHESKVYRYLSDGLNVPAARLYVIDDLRLALVMELLGPSLEDLHSKCGKRFSLKTVCLLADQMLSLLEYLHMRSIIHRDIKPDNFLMGMTESSRVYVVDFGLAKQYCTSRSVPHVKYNNQKSMIGTARYASINAHLGIETSRRDDLESLGYVLLYLFLGHLPWQGLSRGSKNRKYERICERKLSLTPDVLCRHAPQQFRHFITYTHFLRFDQRPDYTYLRQLFRTVMQVNNLKFDNVYDWTSSQIFNHNNRTIQTITSQPIQTPQPPPPVDPGSFLVPRSGAHVSPCPHLPVTHLSLLPPKRPGAPKIKQEKWITDQFGGEPLVEEKCSSQGQQKAEPNSFLITRHVQPRLDLPVIRASAVPKGIGDSIKNSKKPLRKFAVEENALHDDVNSSNEHPILPEQRVFVNIPRNRVAVPHPPSPDPRVNLTSTIPKHTGALSNDSNSKPPIRVKLSPSLRQNSFSNPCENPQPQNSRYNLRSHKNDNLKNNNQTLGDNSRRFLS